MAIVLLLFGAKRIPEIARGMGRGIRQFKDAANDIQEDLEKSVKDVKKQIEERKSRNFS